LARAWPVPNRPGGSPGQKLRLVELMMRIKPPEWIVADRPQRHLLAWLQGQRIIHFNRDNLGSQACIPIFGNV
jgi:hypothetical protein